MKEKPNYKDRMCEICGRKFKPNSGQQKYCVECRKLAYLTQARAHDKERMTNPKRKEYMKQYRSTYYQNNKEDFKNYSKRWRANNEIRYKESKKRYDKEYRKRDIRKKYKNDYNKKRKENDLNYKLNLWSRSQVYRCLNYKNTKKSKTKHTFDILGYTPEQLKQRLEMNFKPDMTWENHGTLWHIDHIKPLCKFNFVLPDGTPNYEQIRLANSLANLQPLYITENLSKGGR